MKPSDEDLRAWLESPSWPEGLEARKAYTRRQDDGDGSLRVVFGEDGDAWISTPGRAPLEGLRFRTLQGGGSSPRVRAALLLLAKAIELDNEERPDA